MIEDTGIRVTTLDNGLRVATDAMPAVDTVSLGIWAGVGTRNEPAAVNGVAHLLEHMAFKGTDRRSARDIAVEIEAVGGHLNAYTSREQTAYYAKVLVEDLPLAVDIIADILQHSTFDEGELARERAVVLQEIGQAEDTPDDIIFDHFQETAYPGQALGRPVLGLAEIVGSLPREAIRGYLHRHYRADRLVLAAAGRIEHDRLVELAAAAFRNLPTGEPESIEPARYQGGDFRQPRDLEQVHLVLGFDGVGYRDPDHYAASVLSTLLGGGMSSRLFQEIREKRGLVYSIYSFASAYTDGGLFGIYAGTGETEAADLVPLICDELVRLPETLDDEEIRRARAQLKAGILMARESTGARCEQLAQHLLVFDRPLSTAEVVAKIDAVDGPQLSRVARRLAASRPTVAALGPIDRVEAFDAIAARLR
ncbi:M16 family metallopeptidase [Rhodospirillaceae bacterium SYSU D60014]|uniref:M16 family metallopeptidase n=1 Tax=Virgifigura deserti TaxID=2268457 RepID=UPI000E668171